MANKLEHSNPGMMGSKRMLQRDLEPSRYVLSCFWGNVFEYFMCDWNQLEVLSRGETSPH